MKKKHTKQTQKPVAKVAPEVEVKQLGKILKADVENGGAAGLSLVLGSTTRGWEVRTYRPFSDLESLFTTARVTSLNALVGVPVEATSVGDTIKSWRILEEVL